MDDGYRTDCLGLWDGGYRTDRTVFGFNEWFNGAMMKIRRLYHGVSPTK
jgi:hypothetical protein